MALTIQVDDPRREDIRALLTEHLRLMHEVTPAGGVFALHVDGLADHSVTFFSVRDDDTLLAVGALQDLGDRHVEIKSMHTVVAARGRGIAQALLDHLLAAATERGYERVSLETGAMDGFAAARRLYERAGFRECPSFGPYVGSTTSYCMTRELP